MVHAVNGFRLRFLSSRTSISFFNQSYPPTDMKLDAAGARHSAYGARDSEHVYTYTKTHKGMFALVFVCVCKLLLSHLRN